MCERQAFKSTSNLMFTQVLLLEILVESTPHLSCKSHYFHKLFRALTEKAEHCTLKTSR